MSKYLKPTLYEGRALENQWINDIFTSHDLFCGCLKPIEHLNHIINQQKCLRFEDVATTTEIGGPGDENDLGIEEGDLDKLFENEKDETG